MKTETVLKILRRYEKNLEYLENEADNSGQSIDRELYHTDKNAMRTARELIEKINDNQKNKKIRKEKA